MAKFKRILLKLSGESLMGEKKYGIDEKRLGEYAQQISATQQSCYLKKQAMRSIFKTRCLE